MSNAAPDPEEKPVPPDEVDRLEEMHQRVKEKQEAWRKLLENLDRLNPGLRQGNNTENNQPRTEKPSQ